MTWQGGTPDDQVKATHGQTVQHPRQAATRQPRLAALHHAAALNANPEVITALLTLGADGQAKTDSGKTAWDLAQDNEAQMHGGCSMNSDSNDN